MNLLKLIDASVRPGFLRALWGWPTFSVTSFLMASSLKAQGLQPRTVIDVGANIGQFAVSMAKVFPHADIVSFEPNPEAFARLSRAARGLRIECVPQGVGREVGNLALHVNAASGTSSFRTFSEKHRALYPEAHDGAARSVPVTTLDAHFAERSPAGPILIKLDVQGFEMEVLDGAPAVLEASSWVVMELSFEALYDGETAFVDMLDRMSSLGWRMLRPVDFLAHPSSREIVQVDALFGRKSPPPVAAG